LPPFKSPAWHFLGVFPYVFHFLIFFPLPKLNSSLFPLFAPSGGYRSCSIERLFRPDFYHPCFSRLRPWHFSSRSGETKVIVNYPLSPEQTRGEKPCAQGTLSSPLEGRGRLFFSVGGSYPLSRNEPHSSSRLSFFIYGPVVHPTPFPSRAQFLFLNSLDLLFSL